MNKNDTAKRTRRRLPMVKNYRSEFLNKLVLGSTKTSLKIERKNKVSKKGNTTIPKNESKKDRFHRVCKPRVQKAMKGIRLIGLCASNNYEYTKADVKDLMDALTKEMAQLQNKFEQPTKTETIAFDFTAKK